MRRRLLLWLPLVIMLSASAAVAQNAPARRKPDIDIGLIWTGGGSLGSRDAILEAPGGGTLKLFSTSTDVGRSFGPEVHVAFSLTRRLRAEAIGTWTRADRQTNITGDFEGGNPETSTLGISIFTAEGAAEWLFPRHGKLEPFLRAGAGWLHELTSDGVLTGDGMIANAGGGVKYWWRDRDRGKLKRLGLRSEIRLVRRSSGLPLGDGTRLVAPAFTAGAILGF